MAFFAILARLGLPVAAMGAAEDAVGLRLSVSELRAVAEARELRTEDGEPEEFTEPSRERPETLDTVNIEAPAFPSYRVREAFRVRLQSQFRPAADFDAFDADLYVPSVRVRVTAPASSRAVLQLTGRFAAAIYEIHGGTDFFGAGPAAGEVFDDFFDTSLSLQGGVRINRNRGLFFEEELWSVLGRVFGRSRWEKGAFLDGATGGGSLGIGYEIDGLIRIGVGVNLQTRMDRGGVKLSPIADLRWNVTDRFKARTRGVGLQLEYELTPEVELFTAGFMSGDKYRLENRPGLPNDLTFRDKVVQAGVGFEWRISTHLRVNLEAGANAWRELRVRSQDLGTLSKEAGNPSSYFDIRFEVRP